MVKHAGVWLLLLVSSWCHVCASRVAQAQPSTNTHQTPTCEVAADLSYCRYPGPGPLLVLLTGLGNDMHSWPPTFLHALNRVGGVLTYDRRGHGRSAALPPAPVTADAAAADLRQLLDRLHISQPVVLVGHSLGGLYAQYFARHYPRQVSAVVLMDAASPFEPIADPRFQTRAALEPGSTDDWEDRGVDTSILQTHQAPPFPRIPLVVLTATDHGAPGAFEQEWQRIQAQTAAQSPLGRQVIAQGSGHDLHHDQPELVIDQIRQLVRQLRHGP
jgi:pimeloyl-ACP methyl ester carboxylesterase